MMTIPAMSIRRGSPRSASSKRGFILVSVLFISSILLGAATTYALFARQEMRRASEEEFALIARSLADVTCETIKGWIASDSNEFDSELEIMYDQRYPFFLTYGTWDVTIKIEPQDRKIPLNGLFLPDGITLKAEYEYPWSEFWRLAGNEMLGDRVLDYLDTNTDARPGSVEETYYANGNISHISQLLHVDGMTPELLYGTGRDGEITLDAYFTVYGQGTVNINVAPLEVLSILDREIGADVAGSIIAYRTDNVIKDEKDLLKVPGISMASLTRLANLIAYKSVYFKVTMNITDGYRERVFEILLRKSGSGCVVEQWAE